jgi:hypothetical protein
MNESVKTYLAAGILGLATLVCAFLITWAVIHNQPLPGVLTTIAGALIGYAAHSLGVQTGVSVPTSILGQSRPATPPAPEPPVTDSGVPIVPRP